MRKTLEEWAKELHEAHRQGQGIEDILIDMQREVLEDAAVGVEELTYHGNKTETWTNRYNEGIRRAARMIRRKKPRKKTDNDGDPPGR